MNFKFWKNKPSDLERLLCKAAGLKARVELWKDIKHTHIYTLDKHLNDIELLAVTEKAIELCSASTKVQSEELKYHPASNESIMWDDGYAAGYKQGVNDTKEK